MTFTDESMQEFDTYAAWARTVREPFAVTPDPETLPEPEFAGITFDEIVIVLNEQETERWEWEQTENDRRLFWEQDRRWW